MTMWIIDETRCRHNVVLENEDRPEESCGQCADDLQIIDGAEFLRRIGMVRDE